MAHACGDALGVEELPDVMGVDAVHVERDGADPHRRIARSENPDPGHGCDSVLEQGRTDRPFMRRDDVHPDLAHVLHSRCEAHDLGDRLRARFEPLRCGQNPDSSIVTVVIMEPPVSTGGRASSSSLRP